MDPPSFEQGPHTLRHIEPTPAPIYRLIAHLPPTNSTYTRYNHQKPQNSHTGRLFFFLLCRLPSSSSPLTSFWGLRLVACPRASGLVVPLSSLLFRPPPLLFDRLVWCFGLLVGVVGWPSCGSRALAIEIMLAFGFVGLRPCRLFYSGPFRFCVGSPVRLCLGVQSIEQSTTGLGPLFPTVALLVGSGFVAEGAPPAPARQGPSNAGI